MDKTTSKATRIGPYQFFMLGLCVAVLAGLAVETSGQLSPEAEQILGYADFFVCGLFLLDFGLSLARAENRLRYFLTWGWIDLLSSIPAVGFLRWGRAARIVRILRVIRVIRSARILSQAIMEQRAESVFLAASLASILIVTVGSIGILQLEQGPGASIRTASDALWWSIVTITTVGYGDVYPVTPEGRILGALLMATGVGLFGTFTALVAAWFMNPDGEEDKLDEIRAELSKIKGMLGER